MMLRWKARFELLVILAWDLTVANLTVMRLCLKRRIELQSTFLKFDLNEALSPQQAMILAHMITATPGTLTIHVDDSGKEITLHRLHQTQSDSEDIASIETRYIRRIRHAF
jgi:multicomponent K+:H+ antiporter subunit E